MISKLHISTLIAIAAIVWGVGLWWQNLPLSWDYLGPYSLVVSIVFLSTTIFNKQIWSLSWLQGWYVDRPDIRGTWKATLESEWIDPATGQKIPPITCYININQTFSSLNLRLMSEKSDSNLIAHSIIKSDDVFQMAGVYMNTPKFVQRNVDSQIHYGSVLLKINGAKPSSLEGHYWTDRNTCGSLVLTVKATI